MLPNLHAGHGLMAQTDSVIFHEKSAELAAKMREHGWSAFRDRPTNGYIGIVVDITSIVYFLTISEPWVLIPLNALIHALTAILLMLIIRKCFGKSTGCEYAALPFLLFPSALSWYGQIHRDGYCFLGFFLILHGWIEITDAFNWRFFSKKAIVTFLELLLGYSLLSASRGYIIQVFINFAPLIILALFARGFLKWHKQALTQKQVLFGFVCILLAYFIARPFEHKSIDSEPKVVGWNPKDIESGKVQLSSWQSSGLPRGIELRLSNLATQRDQARFRSGAGSTSDLDVRLGFHSASDILLYLPRAFQISFLAPFPNQWLSTAGTQSGKTMRLVSALEMLIVYLGLGCLLIRIKVYLRNFYFWISSFLCLGILVIYGLVIVNVGALYRYRYGYLMFFVGLGFAILQLKLADTNNAKACQ